MSEDRVLLQPLSSSTSSPVLSNSCHQNTYKYPTTACLPLALAADWSHFKEEPPGHAPSLSQEANPRAATPRGTRVGDANGRAGDG